MNSKRVRITTKIKRIKNISIFKKLVWGFTLMELLLAITLFSIIATTVYSTLSTGIKVHKRGVTLGGEYNDISLVLDRIAGDFRMAVSINEVYMEKGSDQISFFSCQPMPGGGTQLYKITYKWKRGKDYYKLYRKKETYAESLQDSHGSGDELLDKILKLDFSYGYSKKSALGKYVFTWKSKCTEETLPKLVRARIRMHENSFEEIICCPSGKLGEEKEE